jgi:hypothetical protein
MTEVHSVYCPVRKRWVVALPEELVRQRTIHLLVDQLGYPLSSIVVEKSLRQMPHLALSPLKLPLRRADILCFRRNDPLLLIECKAVPIHSKMIRQLIGYNFYLKAPYIAIVNMEEVRFGWYDKESEDFKFIAYIPTFHSLQ